MSKKKAVLMLRCSSQEQRTKGNSIATQEHELKKRTEDLKIVDIISTVVSASKFDVKRHELIKIYNKCRKNPNYTDYLIYLRVDRFSRNTQIAWEWIRKFRMIGVEINFITQWIPYGKESEVFTLNTYLSVVQTEIMVLSKRTTEGLSSIKHAGYYANSNEVLGYKKIALNPRFTLKDDGTGKLQIIKECFHLFVYANVTRSSLLKSYSATLGIKKSAFYSLFQNHVYAGVNKINGEYIKGNWDGIITLDCFLLSLHKSEKEGRNQKKLASTSKSESFYLKGFIRDERQRLMTASTTTKPQANGSIKKHPYYASRTKGLGRIKKDVAHSVFDRFLKSFKMTKESQSRLIKDIRSKLDSPIRSIRSKTASIQKEIEILENRLNEIKSDYIKKLIEPIDYKEIKEAILDKKENLLLEIESVKEKQGFKLSDIDSVVRSIVSLHTMFKKASNAEKSTLIGCLMPKGFVLDVELNQVRTDYINSVITQLFDLQNVNIVVTKENGTPDNDIPFGGGRPNQFRTDIDAIHKIVEIYKKVA